MGTIRPGPLMRKPGRSFLSGVSFYLSRVSFCFIYFSLFNFSFNFCFSGRQESIEEQVALR